MNIRTWFSTKGAMFLCISACALPFILLLVFGIQLEGIGLGLLVCLGLHLIMMAFFINRQSCHKSAGENEASVIKKISESSVKKF